VPTTLHSITWIDLPLFWDLGRLLEVFTFPHFSCLGLGDAPLRAALTCYLTARHQYIPRHNDLVDLIYEYIHHWSLHAEVDKAVWGNANNKDPDKGVRAMLQSKQLTGNNSEPSNY